VSSEDGSSTSAVERLSAYTAREHESVAESRREAPDTSGTEKEAAPAETEVSADLSAVGDEVGAVLKSAQEAAAGQALRRASREHLCHLP
jgi:hypothetical protein